MDLDFWTLVSYYFIINYAFFLVIRVDMYISWEFILEQSRAGLGDCVMREGKGRTYKNIRKIFFVGAICAALLCGCSVIRIDIRKVRDLPYTVVDEYDVPEEMRQAIADQEQEPFLYTWANEGRLYIARGYGKQDTAGYRFRWMHFTRAVMYWCLQLRFWGRNQVRYRARNDLPISGDQTDYNPKTCHNKVEISEKYNKQNSKTGGFGWNS